MSFDSKAVLLSLAVGLCGVACSQSQMPAERLANAQASIRAAEESGAERTPRSALHLKLAQDQLARAEQMIRNGDNTEAALYLNQAQADAELALALTRDVAAREEARRAAERVEDLRKEAE